MYKFYFRLCSVNPQEGGIGGDLFHIYCGLENQTPPNLFNPLQTQQGFRELKTSDVYIVDTYVSNKSLRAMKLWDLLSDIRGMPASIGGGGREGYYTISRACPSPRDWTRVARGEGAAVAPRRRASFPFFSAFFVSVRFAVFFSVFPVFPFLFSLVFLFFSRFSSVFCRFFLKMYEYKLSYVYQASLYPYVYKVFIRMCKVCIHVYNVCIRVCKVYICVYKVYIRVCKLCIRDVIVFLFF